MASRPIVQQQNRRGAKVPGNAKIRAAADGKSRRVVLGDIGNVDNHYGVDPENISRPITRSFGAKLLAKAQAQTAAAAAATDNKKVAAVAAVDKKVNGKPARAPPAQKMAVAARPVPKPKRQTKTEIIVPEIEIEKPKEEAAELSRKKEVKAFTSILSTRSKAACGVNNCEKKKESVIDIDAGDVENELAVVEYIEDMYKFFKLVEKENRVQDYIHSQPEISKRMRAVLVDWIIEVHQRFDLTMETLYLTINIVDRYLSLQATEMVELQLVGLGAMLMASKYEEIWAPQVNNLVYISDFTYTHEQVLLTEKKILERIEWNLTVATPYVFLVRFIKASVSDANVENMAHFLAELGIANYDAAVMFTPSILAAAAVYVARCSLLKEGLIWNETLKFHTGYLESDLMGCAKLLVDSHSTIGESKHLKTIYTKYSSMSRGAVALLPPAVLENHVFVGNSAS